MRSGMRAQKYGLAFSYVRRWGMCGIVVKALFKSNDLKLKIYLNPTRRTPSKIST